MKRRRPVPLRSNGQPLPPLAVTPEDFSVLIRYCRTRIARKRVRILH